MSKKIGIIVYCAIIIVLGLFVAIYGSLKVPDYSVMFIGLGLLALIVAIFVLAMYFNSDPIDKGLMFGLPDVIPFDPAKGLYAWDYLGWGSYDEIEDTGMMYSFDEKKPRDHIMGNAGIHVSHWEDSGCMRSENGVVYGYSPRHARMLLDQHALRYPPKQKKDVSRSL